MDPRRRPIVRSEVTGRIVERILAEADVPGGRRLDEVINETLYHERRRLDSEPTNERTDADRSFYRNLRRRYVRASESECARFVHDIVERYVDEVCGHFDPKVYAVATRALPVGLSALLNGLSPQRLLAGRDRLRSLSELIVIEGDTAGLLRCQELGTVILAPTHSSNLDSAILGWALFHLGLPPFNYGAGLNLFSNRMVGYFLSHLGAYTVDRRKSDPLYLDVLKEYSTVLLEQGESSLFFPGGTRARSGAVENRLKLGLLGTGLRALVNRQLAGRDLRPIFVVPCTLSYPIVLEASTLIDDHLRAAGKSRYIIEDDEFSQIERWLDYIRGFAGLDMRIHLRLGRPLDVFGNAVDNEGRSLSPSGRPVDPIGYVRRYGRVVHDEARDAAFTRQLGEVLVDAYHRESVIAPTHAVAWAIFDLLRERFPDRDLFRLLRTIGSAHSIPVADVEERIERISDALRGRAVSGDLVLAEDTARRDPRELLDAALRSFACYHATPAIERLGVRVYVRDPNLVFYYRNRLDDYGLLDRPSLLGRRPR